MREVQLLAELTILTCIPNMLKKLLKVHKLPTPFHKVSPKLAAGAASAPPESLSALKIVHAGRRPWDSVVRPGELLNLGEKLFLVPRRTVRKLRRRIRKPDREVSSNSFASKSCVDLSVDKVSCKSNDFPSKSFCQQSEANVSAEKTASKKKNAVKKHVRFVGIEGKDSHLEDGAGNKSLNCRSHEEKRRPRNAAASWQPSLMAVCEKK